MCLSIPARIEEINGEMARCSVGQAEYEASLQMLDINELAVGDYVLLHTGFALQKISEEEAIETLKLFDEFEAFNESLDEEEKQSGQRIV
ncbi:MAG: HypC/HybG/HupF family hydrogenase formation chaperone [Bacteroidetes bacterium]|jgi:hydrogenase expression/formation protein HypC|nr:HypC/HybG/HupF family hydrogenase formation chaperone [Bacteroidota bacterium]MBU1580092.1 HypC/HybG/HupF family hydrogenase formation chaperone [Bacteroidota bacterium]MBU2465018.1 HypC/HybG/HupF family hydrogenase formation chaperone [Bacteroidota bacterium]MBU2556656.1 HypC/HybG/HupF family hydrogenase formation chaperone [Bacteroidota bacterium]MDA3943001.1 HypC/HybG/HupF family hydrogenase formation chaperone [Bacteroidota bacterium]